MADRMQFSEDDPRYHTSKLKEMLNETINHAREDVGKVNDAKAKALFETTAEVLGGSVKLTTILRKREKRRGGKQAVREYGFGMNRHFKWAKGLRVQRQEEMMTMMRKLCGLILLAGLTGYAAHASDDATSQKLDERLNAARNTIDQIMSVPDKAVPDDIARKAVCVGIVPGVVKGAFLVGAEYGQGVVTCRTATGWSAPVFIRLAGGSFGFQAGGQGTDLVLVALNDRGMQALLKDKFKIGADASAAAGPVGRDAQASTDASMRAELLTWSRSRGVFGGIDLSGASISQNKRDTDEIYGGEHSFEQILHGQVRPTGSERSLLEEVSKYFGSSSVAQR